MVPVIDLLSLSEFHSLAASQSVSHVSLYTGPISTADTYFFGQCTYWASLRREQSGHPIPNNWGNANTWAIRASLAGYTVDHTPTVGAIMQTTAGPFGHVAYVEAVDLNGGWTISEMNYRDWDITDNRTLSQSEASDYNFIQLMKIMILISLK